MKNNKPNDVDFIAAELLKNGGTIKRDIQSLRQNSTRPPFTANTAVQHYQAGFQSCKSTTDQLFALRQ
jgi:hypothetical protein